LLLLFLFPSLLARFVCVSNLRLFVASSTSYFASEFLTPPLVRVHKRRSEFSRNLTAGGRGAQHRPRQHALNERAVEAKKNKMQMGAS
jgi:hypothetical protein